MLYKQDAAWSRMKTSNRDYFIIHLKEKLDALGRGSRIKLANLLGVHPSILSLWEKGECFPSDENECIIALYLGCQRDEIWRFRADKFEAIKKLAELHAQESRIEKEIEKTMTEVNADEENV